MLQEKFQMLFSVTLLLFDVFLLLVLLLVSNILCTFAHGNNEIYHYGKDEETNQGKRACWTCL